MNKKDGHKNKDDLIENSFSASSSFLKRILDYAPISQTLQKSQEIYQRAKKSNKIIEYSCEKVEVSVQKIVDSPLVKYVDNKINLIDGKLAVNERGNKVLDIVEEKTEKVIESSKSYYNKGKDIVEQRTGSVVDLYNWGKGLYDAQKSKLVEKGQEIYEEKKDQAITLYSIGRNTLEEKKEEFSDDYQHRIEEYRKKKAEILTIGEDMLNSGKKRAVNIFTQTKGEYVDKPQKYVTELLNSKYVHLKDLYPSVQKIDQFYEKGKVVAENQKEKAIEIYSSTCQYYNIQKDKYLTLYTQQKDVVKQKSLEYYSKGTQYIDEGKKYILTTTRDDSAPSNAKQGGDYNTEKSMNYLDTIKSLVKDNLPFLNKIAVQ